MKRNVIAACILSSALVGIGNAAQAPPSQETDAHSMKARVKQLARDAHTPDQYKVLASYYDDQQTAYLKQAADEKQEWILRSQNIVGVAAKYPRPVDSARNLYEYYTYKAAEAGDQHTKYAQLCVSSNPTKVE